jgi:hypothetical protein
MITDDIYYFHSHNHYNQYQNLTHIYKEYQIPL